MPLTGDFVTLKRWEKRLGQLASGTFMLEVSRDQAQAAVVLVEKGFDKQADPFNNPWPRKKEPDGRKVLHGKTGKLRKSFRLGLTNSSGWSIKSNDPKSKFHQKGTATYAGRPPYIIRPKKPGGKLAFRSGGQMFFRPKVEHPGVPIRRMVPGKTLPTVWSLKFGEIYRKKARKVATGR
jgi:hypothetical protein